MSLAPNLFKTEPALVETPDSGAESESLFPALAFRRLALHRMPGITHGFKLEGLSPGINVIFGPNGCGKTRSAAAMNLVLWPRGAVRAASIEANFDIGHTRWQVELDAGQVRYLREGAAIEDAPASLPPADNRDRYNLPLHELLSEDRSQFAQLIVRETAGGYDVPLATELLGYKQNPSNAKVAAGLREAKAALDDARRKQKDVHDEAAGLEELNEKRKNAQAAADRALILRSALKYEEAQRAWQAAVARVENFPAALKSLSGSEWKAYQQHSRELNDSREARQRKRVDVNRAAAVLADCRLPETGVPGDVLPTLGELSGRLDRAAIELRTCRLEKEKARAARESARSRIAPALRTRRSGRMIIADLQPFADLARHAEQTRGALQAEAEVKAWLGDDVDRTEPAADLQTLQEGIGFLQRWLREPRPVVAAAIAPSGDPLLKTLAWIATGLLSLVAIILAAAVHAGWIVLILPAGALGVVLFLKGRETLTVTPAPAVALHEIHQREYAKLSLQQPAAWTPDAVEPLLRKLIVANAANQMDAERSNLWAARDARRTALLRQQEELIQLRSRLASTLGIAPASDPGAMFTLVSNVNAWQFADVKVAEAEAAEAKVLHDYRSDLEAAGSIVAQFGYPAPGDPAGLAGATDDLRRRHALFEKARVERAGAADAAAVADRRIAELESRILQIFKEAQIAPEAVRTLEDFCSQHPEYCKAVKDAEVARQLLEQTAIALAAHEGLKALPREELRQQLSEAEEEARLLESIDQQVGGIRSQIEAAKKSNTVEACLAQFEAQKDALREKREDDCNAVAGWILAQHVKRESNDRQRPAVFRRARELFANVTQGKYRLDLDDSTPGATSPAFRAFDNATGVAHPLNELSGATRLQLLLSVRVAFVEQQERGARLPIFIDEALANSDENRARTIIEAAIELARSGRQIFYFTAQLDEVAKWEQFLQEAPDVSHRLIDLAVVRGLAENERLPLPQGFPQTPRALPEPAAGESYGAYGQRLKVPAVDLWAESVGGAHLWHLLSDAATLHAFLARGVSTWGQVEELRSVSRAGGSRLFRNLEAACHRAEGAATALAAMIAGWRVGRGRPIDRAVLLDSGAVSGTYIDTVYRLTEQQGFDAARLINSLRAGEVKGFRTKFTDELRAYLIEHRFLDERAHLSRDEVRLRMLDAAGEAISAGALDAAWIEATLDRALAAAVA